MLRLRIVAQDVEVSPQALPLGAASIVAALRTAPALQGRVDVELLAGAPDGDPAELLRRIAAQSPEAVGFSVYCWNRERLGALARRLRSSLPRLILFAGGPETSADPLGVMKEFGLDFAISGEGESAAVAAVTALLEGRARDIGSIPGALTPAGESEGRSLERCPPVVEDPEQLASPWLVGILDPAEYDGALWELTRGCPYRCAYCYESKGTAGLRHLNLERLRAELDRFVRRGVGQVFVLDPTFNADRERARSILGLLAERGSGIHWHFEVRAELLDRVLVEGFSRLSCSLQIGLQSADPEVLASVGRSLDRELFRRKLGLLNAAGLTFGLDLIYGLPGESLAGFAAGLDFALGLQPNHLDIFPLAVLPGTELADRAARLGLVHDARPPYLLSSSPALPAADFARARRLAEACTLFYTQGRAVSWFLQALRPLRMKASAFLWGFADWLESRDVPSGSAVRRNEKTADASEIESMQLAYLDERYRSLGHERLLPALRDIVRFNAAWGRAVADGSATELELSYDPDEVLGPQALDLRTFVRAARPRSHSIAVLPSDEGGARMIRRSRSGRAGR
ncbi:MAG TPA: radical SAM protein [Rectinemataceae bacterium]|nr:radical SAM protein [Rectinemataceae bacterium]